MGIAASCQPKYPNYKDFIYFIQNANNFIILDTCVWTFHQKRLLQTFFQNIQTTIQDHHDPLSQLPWKTLTSQCSFQKYYNQARLVVPRYKKISKIYAALHNGENYNNVDNKTRTEYAQIYASIAFFWSIFNNGNNSSKYFYKSDLLHSLYNSDYQLIEDMTLILEKIYFTNKKGYIPAYSLLIPTCGFQLIEGKIKSLHQNDIITGPKTYTIIQNDEQFNEPFYTISPIKIRMILGIPNQIKSNKDGAEKIYEDINILVAELKNKEDRNKIFDIDQKVFEDDKMYEFKDWDNLIWKNYNN